VDQRSSFRMTQLSCESRAYEHAYEIGSNWTVKCSTRMYRCWPKKHEPRGKPKQKHLTAPLKKTPLRYQPKRPPQDRKRMPQLERRRTRRPQGGGSQKKRNPGGALSEKNGKREMEEKEGGNPWGEGRVEKTGGQSDHTHRGEKPGRRGEGGKEERPHPSRRQSQEKKVLGGRGRKSKRGRTTTSSPQAIRG